MPRIIQPDGWPRPKGYSNGMAASGEFLAVAGQVGWDRSERMVSDEFVAQFRQALHNVVAVVESAGGEAADLINLTLYVTDRDEYAQQARTVGEAYREIVGRHFPAMTLVEVADLLELGAKVEIQGLAILPK